MFRLGLVKFPQMRWCYLNDFLDLACSTFVHVRLLKKWQTRGSIHPLRFKCNCPINAMRLKVSMMNIHYNDERNDLPSLKLTWHLKMDGWNTSVLLGWRIFRGYVSFREGILIPFVLMILHMPTVQQSWFGRTYLIF